MGGRFGSSQAKSLKRTHKWMCHVVTDERFDPSQVNLWEDIELERLLAFRTSFEDE